MTICVRITSCDGAPPLASLFAEFNEGGGCIGRAEGNALVLHDPMQRISRKHASVEFRDGNYFIRNLGTATPVYLNGQPLGNGRDAVITAGDEIRIGGYTMRVTSPIGQDSPSIQSVTAASKDDPLRLFSDLSQTDPFDTRNAPPERFAAQPYGGSSKANEVRNSDPVAAPSNLWGVIPSDFDPFQEALAPRREQPRDVPGSPGAPLNDALDLGFGPSTPNKSIDDLFDLKSGTARDPFAPRNPLELSPGEESVDPMQATGAASRQTPRVGQVQRDDVLELHGSFPPPEVKPDLSMQSTPPMQPGITSSSETYRMVLSWETEEAAPSSGGNRSVIIPSPRGRPEGGTPLSQQQPVKEVVAESPPAPHSLHGNSTEAAAKNIAYPEELLHAFLAGAGVPDLAIPLGLTPQFMSAVGQLLRESTQGSLNLLLARTLTKREVRADLTMIAPRENNPLKFSPNVEAALVHLLSSQKPGFMAPRQAIRDANNDLLSHQFGVMAGMRAALAGVLERFDPVKLEKRITQKTMIDSLVPTNRKAKLWDLFAERYSEISFEAEEDFHVLFGKEFLRAYEAQIAKLEQGDKGNTENKEKKS